MTRSSLWVPQSSASPPPEHFPPRFRTYEFDRSVTGWLFLPKGGVTFDGVQRIFGFDLQTSDPMPPAMCVVKSKGSGRRRKTGQKQHIVQACDVPADRQDCLLTPMCGQQIKRWELLASRRETMTICTKAAYEHGGLWCSGCVVALRRRIDAIADAGGGRATHIMLEPIPDSITDTPGPLDAVKDKGEILLMTYVLDTKSHEHPEYGYCRDCLRPHHSVRNNALNTDWVR